VERALVQTDSLISPVARFAAKNKTQVANAVRSMMRKYPSVRLIVGRHAADAAPVLIKKRGVNPDLVIYAQECTDDIVAAIDAGVDTGGWVKGCVDRNPAGAGKLAGDVLTRLAGGSRVPEINEVQVIPYEPGFRG
jgi:ABC-type sugar transport system substrate-binding protein